MSDKCLVQYRTSYHRTQQYSSLRTEACITGIYISRSLLARLLPARYSNYHVMWKTRVSDARNPWNPVTTCAQPRDLWNAGNFVYLANHRSG